MHDDDILFDPSFQAVPSEDQPAGAPLPADLHQLLGLYFDLVNARAEPNPELARRAWRALDAAVHALPEAS